MMEWSNNTTMEFLDLYEKEIIIWDFSHNLHKNRNEVYDAWKRIQTEFSKNISIAELKKKKESLMATFRNCLSKIKQSEKSGTGTDDVYKPTWFAFSKMAKFLTHYDTPRNTINLETIKLENVGDGQDNGKQDKTQFHDIANISVGSGEPGSSGIKRKIALEPPTTKINKITQEVIYEKMEKAYNILQKKSQPKEKDECDIFGELIAKRLRAMEQSKRDYIMHEIENLMYQAKMRFSQPAFPQSFQQNSMNSQFAALTQSNMFTSTPSHATPSTVTPSPPCSQTYSQYSNPLSVTSVSNSSSESAKDYHEGFE